MKKKLLFHFYVPHNFTENKAINCHLWCLKRYCNVFDESEIIVSQDEFCTDEEIKRFIEIITSIGFKNLIIRKCNNSVFRESETLYNYIQSNNLNDKFVFFGHSKGISNLYNKEEKVILGWIFNLYYFNLELDFVKDALRSLSINRNACLYGNYLICDRNRTDSAEELYYSGSFYWFNREHLYRESKNIELSDRFYSENLPRVICNGKNKDNVLTEFILSSYRSVYMYGDMFDFYYNDNYAENFDYLLGTEYNTDRNEVFNSMLSDIRQDEIQIITIATNSYIVYLDSFIETIDLLFPGLKKNVTILTNHDITGKYNNVKVYKIPDLIYPTVNVNKTYLVEQYIDMSCKYVFYFDVDSYFVEQTNDVWETLIDEMDNGKVIVTKHPFYSLMDDISWYGVLKKDCISNFYTNNLTEKNKWSCCYIPSAEYTYINSAMYGGRTDVMLSFSQKITEMEKTDLRRHFNKETHMTYHIPQFIDENYFNKCVYDYEKGHSDFNFSVRRYNRLDTDVNIDYDFCIVIQKYNTDLKTNRR